MAGVIMIMVIIIINW
jgi:hypothetical protein